MTRMSLLQGNGDMIPMNLRQGDKDMILMLHLREEGMTPMHHPLEEDMTQMHHHQEGDMILMLHLPEEGRIPILMFHHLVGRQGKKIPTHLRRARGRKTLTLTCHRPEEAISPILTRRHRE